MVTKSIGIYWRPAPIVVGNCDGIEFVPIRAKNFTAKTFSVMTVKKYQKV